MSQSSRYETMLGHLGAYLACQDARKIEIADEGVFVSVSWQAPGAGRAQSWCLREEEITRLHPASRLARQESTSRAALLATLGRRLDQTGMDVARIEEKTDSFQISGATSGRYSNQRVGYWELRTTTPPRREPAPEPTQAVQAVAPISAAIPTPAVEPPKVTLAPAPAVTVTSPASTAPSAVESDEPTFICTGPLRRRLRLD